MLAAPLAVRAIFGKVKVKVKVTSLYMPQRASQRKLGKSLQLNLCKQRGGDYDKKEKGTEKGLGWRRKGESRMA